MKGIIFNLLEEVVSEHYGDDVWDKLLDHAGAGGSYTSLGSYPDREIAGLVTAASQTLNIPSAEVLHWFGRNSVPRLMERYPEFFLAHDSVLGFLRSLNSVIHAEVRKLYPGALCPHFDISGDDAAPLLLGYRSARRMCHLAHGFIDGAADHYHQPVEVRHLRCMLLGDDACLLAVRPL